MTPQRLRRRRRRRPTGRRADVARWRGRAVALGGRQRDRSVRRAAVASSGAGVRRRRAPASSRRVAAHAPRSAGAVDAVDRRSPQRRLTARGLPTDHAGRTSGRQRRAQERPQLGAQAAQPGPRRVQPTARSASGSVAIPVTCRRRRRRPGVDRRGAAARPPSRRRGTARPRWVSGSTCTRSRSAWVRAAGSARAPARAGPGGGRRGGTRPRTTASMRSRGSSGAARNGCGDDDLDLPRRRLQHGVDELLLAGEPVQDGLLAHTDDGGDVVEGDAVDAAGAEQVERGGEDALAGRAPRCWSSTSLYQLVDRRARHVVVIAEALAGKRIAITGSTGFVGTALVERLLRSRARLRARAARARRQAHAGGPAGAARAAQERRLRPPARRARRRRSTPWPPSGSRRSPATSAPTASACPTATAAVLADVRHRHPLGGRRLVRLAARLGRGDQPARPDAHRPAAAASSA